MAESIVCGPDPERYVEAIGEYVTAGFDHVSVHQVGPDQEGFFRFFARDVMPRVRKLRAAGRAKRRASRADGRRHRAA